MKRLILFLTVAVCCAVCIYSYADASDEQTFASAHSLSANQTADEVWPGSFLKNDPRAQRDGFSGGRNRQYDFMEFRLPEYWGVDGSAECFTAYAETGKKLSMLEVHTDAEDNSVFSLSADEAESNGCLIDVTTCLAGLESRGYSDCELISMKYTDAGRQVGLLFSCRAVFRGFPVNIVSFVCSFDDSSHWALLLCSFSDAALYRYDADFLKIVSGIQWNRDVIGIGTHSSAPETDAMIQIIQAASVRDEPSYDGERIVLASPDECYRLLGTEDGWYEILLETNVIGYFPQKYAVLIGTESN